MRTRTAPKALQRAFCVADAVDDSFFKPDGSLDVALLEAIESGQAEDALTGGGGGGGAKRKKGRSKAAAADAEEYFETGEDLDEEDRAPAAAAGGGGKGGKGGKSGGSKRKRSVKDNGGDDDDESQPPPKKKSKPPGKSTRVGMHYSYELDDYFHDFPPPAPAAVAAPPLPPQAPAPAPAPAVVDAEPDAAAQPAEPALDREFTHAEANVLRHFFLPHRGATAEHRREIERLLSLQLLAAPETIVKHYQNKRARREEKRRRQNAVG